MHLRSLLVCLVASAASFGQSAQALELSFAPEDGNFELRAGMTSTKRQATYDGRTAWWLVMDTREEAGDWNELALSDLAAARPKPKGCYRIDFEYRVVAQGEFYCLLRSFGKTRSDRGFTRWVYPTGWHGRRKVFVRLEDRDNYRLILGIKGRGAIEIGPVSATLCDDPVVAEKTAALPDVTAQQLGRQFADLRSLLGKIQLADAATAAKTELARLRRRCDEIEARLQAAGTWSDTSALLLREIREEQMVASVLRAYAQDPSKATGPAFGLGVETSLRKVFRDRPLEGRLTGAASLRAARGEWESFQFVVIPYWRDLRNVRIELSDLRSQDNRSAITTRNMTWYRVGYVKTERAVYPAEHLGWWPDPLLPQDAAERVERDEQQPFWIEIRVPRSAAPGRYQGRVRVLADGVPSREATLRLRVSSIVLPRRSRLRSCIGTSWGRPINEMVLRHRLSPRIAQPTMLRTVAGGFRFDFTPFDEAVHEYLAADATDIRIGNLY